MRGLSRAILLLLASCGAVHTTEGAPVSDSGQGPTAGITDSRSEQDSSRLVESFRLLEDIAAITEQYLQTTVDGELSAAWERTREARNSESIQEFIANLHVCENGSSFDTNSPMVTSYLYSWVPTLIVLQDRYETSSLSDPLDSAYSRFMAQLSSSDGTPAGHEPRKKRPHCCSFAVGIPPAGVETWCFQVNDNDFNSFFECVGLIGGSFSISRGACGSGCSRIMFE